MVRKRNSRSENIETVRETNGHRKRPNLVPAGRPLPENSADTNEQLRTEVEELQRQILELRELKRLDEHSIEGWEWLARIAEENPDPVLQVSKHGVSQYRNPAAFSLCRQWNPADEMIVPPAIHKIIKAAYANAQVIRQEMMVGEDTYLVTVAPAPAPAKYVNIYASDITARKRAEEALRESEEKFRVMANTSQAAISLYRGGHVIYTNPAAEVIFGYSLDERRRMNFLEMIHPDFRPLARERMEALLEGAPTGSQHEYKIIRKDGQERWVLSSGSHIVVGGKPAVMVSSLDITDRKRAEETLRESEERLHLALGAARMGVWQWEVGTENVVWSPELYALLGYEPARVTPTHQAFRQRIHPQDLARWEQAIRESMERCEDYACEFRVVWADGSVHWAEARGQYAYTGAESGTKTMWMRGVMVDIEQRKRAEEALRESEERLRFVVKSSPDTIFVQDRDLRYVWMNRPAHPLTHEKLVGHTDMEMLLPEDAARLIEIKQRVLSQGQRQTAEVHVTWEGQVRFYEAIFEPWRDATGAVIGVAGYARDITGRKQAEEELRKLTATLESKVMQRTAQLRHRAQQLQKLTLEMSEAEDRERKRLAAILHDDVQQIIAAAKYQLSVLRNRIKDDVSVQAISAQIDRMLKEAVEKSRGLSHEISPAALYGDFVTALDRLASQMQAKHGLTVQVHASGQIHLQSDAVKALVYRMAQELLFNTVKHAQVKEARIRVRRLGGCLCLTVSDHGRGFDPQELRETAGFGLLSIRERIELLGGRMKIKSTKGKGSTFFIVVPDGETATVE